MQRCIKIYNYFKWWIQSFDIKLTSGTISLLLFRQQDGSCYNHMDHQIILAHEELKSHILIAKCTSTTTKLTVSNVKTLVRSQGTATINFYFLAQTFKDGLHNCSKCSQRVTLKYYIYCNRSLVTLSMIACTHLPRCPPQHCWCVDVCGWLGDPAGTWALVAGPYPGLCGSVGTPAGAGHAETGHQNYSYNIL